jgi:hypothetical protein
MEKTFYIQPTKARLAAPASCISQGHGNVNDAMAWSVSGRTIG